MTTRPNLKNLNQFEYILHHINIDEFPIYSS